MASETAEMAAMLDGYGDRFSGNNSLDEAQGWLDEEFSRETADPWCEIGVWDAAVAAALRDAGLTPQQVSDAAAKLVDGMDDDERCAAYTDGNPVYSVCNCDTSVEAIIEAAD
jgi:hypothetical protein